MEFELVSKKEFETPVTEPPPEENSMVYTGSERRKTRRRTMLDRREMVRFEIKVGRRQAEDRRSELKTWDGRNY